MIVRWVQWDEWLAAYEGDAWDKIDKEIGRAVLPGWRADDPGRAAKITAGRLETDRYRRQLDSSRRGGLARQAKMRAAKDAAATP